MTLNRVMVSNVESISNIQWVKPKNAPRIELDRAISRDAGGANSSRTSHSFSMADVIMGQGSAYEFYNLNEM